MGMRPWAGDIESAANLSHWFEDHLASMAQLSTGPVLRDGIYKFHQFKFSLLLGVPIMRVREWCGDDEAPWRGLKPESTHHVVFNGQVPTPDDLAETCPPAQRSALPTNPAHIKKNAKGVVTGNHTSRTRAGVEAIIRNRNIPADAQADLQRCLALMESTDDLPFHWDMTMYRAHAQRRADAPAIVEPASSALVGLHNEGEASAPSNDDLTSEEDTERKQLQFDDAEDEPAASLPPDQDGFVPAPLVVNNTHLVRLGGITWGLARYDKEGRYSFL